MDKKMKVEVLNPPLFTRSGRIVDREIAWKEGLWYGQFNIWVIKKTPVPSIIYQKRSPSIGWAPNKLDVPIGGHYENGEDFESAVKNEAKEELGIDIDLSKLIHIGKKLAVNKGAFDNTNRNVVIDIYFLEDERPISQYEIIDKQEVYGLCELAVKDVLSLLEGKIKKLEKTFLRNDGKFLDHTITKRSFVKNWDNYQEKIVRLIDRYSQGEKELQY